MSERVEKFTQTLDYFRKGDALEDAMRAYPSPDALPPLVPPLPWGQRGPVRRFMNADGLRSAAFVLAAVCGGATLLILLTGLVLPELGFILLLILGNVIIFVGGPLAAVLAVCALGLLMASLLDADATWSKCGSRAMTLVMLVMLLPFAFWCSVLIDKLFRWHPW